MIGKCNILYKFWKMMLRDSQTSRVKREKKQETQGIRLVGSDSLRIGEDKEKGWRNILKKYFNKISKTACMSFQIEKANQVSISIDYKKDKKFKNP